MAEKEETFYEDLEDLPGIGPAIAEKLRVAGYNDIQSITSANPHDLVEAADMKLEKAKEAIEAAKKSIKVGFESGDIVYERRKRIGKITTGSKSFDELLGGGGVETQAITEAYARFSAGKTQVGFQLCVNVQKPLDQGGLNGKVLFIDTEHTFRPERIMQIATENGMDGEEILKNIFVARAENSDHQILLVEKAEELIAANNVKLVIVDSLTSHFRSDYAGRGALGDRQQKLNKHVHILQKLADKYNLAVYITNQVMDDPAMMFGDPTKPIGGHILAHACLTSDTLVQLTDGTIKEIRKLSVSDSLIVVDKNYKNTTANLSTKVIKEKINEVYVIDSGYKITASPQHRFFKIDNFEIKEVQAQNIREGDWLLRSTQMNFDGKEQTLPEIEETTDTDEVAILDNDGAEFVKRRLIEKGFRRTDICQRLDMSPRQLRRVLNQSYPTTFGNFNQLAYELEDEDIFEYVRPVSTGKRRIFKLPFSLNSEFAQALGYIIGDGNLSKNSVRIRDARIQVLEEYKKMMQNLFDFEGSITKVKDKNCHQLAINSIDVRELFEKTKMNLFELISRSPKEVVKAFIKGFTDAEGYVSKTRPRIQIAQKNEQTLRFIQMLLLRFGIRAPIKEAKRASVIMIDSKEVTKFAEEIGITAEDKCALLKKWVKYNEGTYKVERIPIERTAVKELLKKYNLLFSKFMKPRPDNKGYKYMNKRETETIVKFFKDNRLESKEVEFMRRMLESDVAFEEVKKITKKGNDTALYDITVPGYENFIANGFITHNSTYRLYLRKGKEDKRVARLVDSPNLPEGECVFKVGKAGVTD